MNKKKSVSLINDSFAFAVSITALVALVLDYGYSTSYWMHLGTDIFYLLSAFIYLYYFLGQFPKKGNIKDKPLGYYFVLFLAAVLAVISLLNTTNFLFNQSANLNLYTAGMVFILTIFDLSGRLYRLDRQTLHPALVFALSFVVLICIGTLLLMAPKATVNNISFIDAIFTATSAVCVTGLAVLDTGKDFTFIGQMAILGLIQLGALGMLSFTSLFALFFKGFGSFESRLNIKDMINADTIDGTFRRLTQIVLFVFLIEGIGAVVIFSSLEGSIDTFNERIFFSVFHSISAFCNAGFSTLSDSLYEEGFRYNYGLHACIAILIVFGGLGYGVFIDIYQYFKKSISYSIYRIFKFSWSKNPQKLKPHLSLNSKIVLNTSLILIIAGTLLFYFLEINNTLQEHSQFGKLMTSIFGSITTRTAGFNTVDTGSLHLSTLVIVLFLMWIGASPGSTGGGIKTTTFAVATFSIVQQVFGYKSIRIGYRRISQTALNRATAILSLSLVTIGISTFLLIYLDEELGVMQLAFESFSAFSTVGLSMGITNQLSDSSKFVVILTMFVGRVGLLTILTGMIRQIHTHSYSPIEYPEEEIFIN